MTDKKIIINDVDISGCEYCLKMTKYRCTIQRDVYKCLCEENPNCHYKQLKQSEQNAQDTYDMFKACIQRLEIARKQLSDEQQKVYQIGKICKKYSVNYVTNAGVQLMINKIMDIIGDKTDE